MKRFIFLFLAGMATGAVIAEVRTEYEEGCALRTISAFSPTGDVAKYRYAGYLEAMEVIYHSTMTDVAKSEALDTLITSPEIEKYAVTRSE